ncbi:MAG: hypothetical protein IPI43_11285 [Sandaracinaceae bacterium]|nr:hypothetical protein [Sandaracinaceae bacterium]
MVDAVYLNGQQRLRIRDRFRALARVGVGTMVVSSMDLDVLRFMAG